MDFGMRERKKWHKNLVVRKIWCNFAPQFVDIAPKRRIS